MRLPIRRAFLGEQLPFVSPLFPSHLRRCTSEREVLFPSDECGRRPNGQRSSGRLE